ncbi:MAG: phosphoadenosine phosphosulfate reductase family protein [Methanobacterium sp.]|jgi:phosphoadenosine phosphosulfate reductase|uniref:phosphoadenosine phosphosulfate reductase domain-containing protein n=1 Tax=Methanobacterium sp. TaxID=2164 RepID=UPI00258BF21F|nr:phosphoadenosine phosphosulfate reductase family protein [Methanobacterium sp.]MCC7559778.1 phosphoadenosine phosphosulfate reductase family protein [Methanobacterium sp.]
MNQDLVEEATAQIKSLDFSKSVVMFSGGKDSLVVMDIAKKAGLNKSVYINSELEFTISRRYVEQMKENYNIEDVIPKIDFFEFCRRICPPSKRLKWCCKVLKLALSMKHAIKTGNFYQLTGIRSDESDRRSKYEVINADPFINVNKRYTFFQVNPILYWSEEDVWDYIRENKLKYNPLYDHGVKRVGCWCCPYTTRSEWELARDLEGENFQKFKNIIKDFSRNLPANFRNRYNKKGWRSFATNYNKIKVLKMTNNKNSFVLEGKKEYLEKIQQLIFIVADRYKIEGSKLYFERNIELQRRQIRLVLEKPLNCVGCDVCTVICPVNALYLENESIKVDPTKCVGCLSCCKKINGKLKMGCIARNYKTERFCITF